jgi:2-dehydro-3-deoxy-D-gluconate 5-dehydrogenase
MVRLAEAAEPSAAHQHREAAPVILEQFSLAGKKALVTGASRGIGRAIALGLAEAGADVALASRGLENLQLASAEIQQLGRSAPVIVADVRDLAQIEPMVQQAIGELGQLDILVNAAGIPSRKPTVDLTQADYDELYNTNIRSVIFCCQAAGRHMTARGSGSIVNIGSLTTTLGFAGRALYGSSKGAIGQLTKSLAVEWGPVGVRVNAIAPGWIVTGLSRAALQDPTFSARVVDRTPLGRLGYPDDLKGITVFLASDAAAFVTGQIIFVDGGYIAN